MKSLGFVIGFAMLLAACSNDASRSTSDGTATGPAGNLPAAHGGVNQVLVVCDSSLWAGPVGDSFLYYFGAPYLILPSPEPIFDVQQTSPEALAQQPQNKESRNIIFLANMGDEKSSTVRLLRADLGEEKIKATQQSVGYNVTTGQDKWASQQQLFYCYGFGGRKLAQGIAANFPAIAQRINEKDNELIRATAYKDGEAYELQDEVLAKYGLHLKLPKGFMQEAYDAKSGTMLLRKNDGANDIVYDVLLRKLPFQDKSQLTEQGIQKIREETVGLGKKAKFNMLNIAADDKLPIFVEDKPMNGIQAVQARGVWRDGNFTGPFVSNLLLNHKTNELIFLEGFVAVKMDGKRNPIQMLELVLSSTSF